MLIIRNRINKVEKYSTCWDSISYLALENLVFLLTLPWEYLEFRRSISEIIKIFAPTEFRAQTYCLRSFCPNLTVEIFFEEKELAGKTRKTTLLIELFLLHILKCVSKNNKFGLMPIMSSFFVSCKTTELL